MKQSDKLEKIILQQEDPAGKKDYKKPELLSYQNLSKVTGSQGSNTNP